MPTFMQGQKSVSVYLPGKESWYDLRNGSPYKGSMSHKLQVLEDSIPSFQRGGTIVPRKDRFRRSSTQMVNDPYTLVYMLSYVKKHLINSTRLLLFYFVYNRVSIDLFISLTCK